MQEKKAKDKPPVLKGDVKKMLKGQKASTQPEKGYDTPNKARRAMVVGLMKHLKKQGKIAKVGKGARESTEVRQRAAESAGDMINKVMEGGDVFEVLSEALNPQPAAADAE